MGLGKLKQIKDLRLIWNNEALDFTPWLAREENLKMLSEEIGIDIIFEERESAVGDFSVDLFAVEEGTGRKIIIENQLEETDHDHLGKIIVYASGKEAEVVIWIVRKARDEHKQAIEWLNQHTDDKCAFFLIEIELWQIDDSRFAPKFNIVERPNDWAKAMKKSATLSAAANLQLDFWTEFNNNAASNPEFSKKFRVRKPQAQHWYDLGVGAGSYHINLTLLTQKKFITAGVYIRNDMNSFQKFKDNEDKLKEILGCNEIEWVAAKKDSRFMVSKPLDVNNKESWQEGLAWLYDQCLRIKKAISIIMK